MDFRLPVTTGSRTRHPADLAGTHGRLLWEPTKLQANGIRGSASSVDMASEWATRSRAQAKLIS
jgi:hypothetical protein